MNKMNKYIYTSINDLHCSHIHLVITAVEKLSGMRAGVSLHVAKTEYIIMA